jgi:2-methylcitrate dehydratase
MDAKHPSASERIAQFVAQARYEDLPRTVVEKAKQQIVFFLSRALEGHDAYEAIQASRVVTPATAGPGATVIGEPVRLNPADAAFSNCARMRGAGGRDDVTWPGGIHTGVITLPTALAMAETVHAPGRDLLLALVLGYEVPNKLARLADPWNSTNPRRPTNVYGAFAPITVAGRLMRLDAEGLARAYGYAVNLGIGVAESGMMDHYYALVNRAGILGAQLAEVGGGPYDRYTIEGPAGLYYSFFGAVPKGLDKQLASLGRHWEILDAEQKIYPGTGQHAPSIHQILEILRATRLDPKDIQRIVVVEPETGDSMIRKHEVSYQGPFARSVQAYSSLPYGIAVALIDGRVDLARFPDEDDLVRINDPEVAALMRRIFLTFEPGHGPRYSRTTVTLSNGETLHRTDERFSVDLPRTDWGSSLARFGHGLLSEAQLQAVERMLIDLEQLEDSATLLQALRPQEAIP